MAVEIEIAYEGGLHCQAKHGPSGRTLTTDAPADNGGKGESFSPTDLVATALGTCMMTVIGLLAERHKWNLEGSTVTVRKEMVQTPFRRIGGLPVKISIANSASLSAEDRMKIENAAHTCPVHKSLHPDVHSPVEFIYV